MAWAKVDDGWWAHPKVMGLSLPARGLWVSALSWSCHQRQDTVPERFLAMVSADVEHAVELVEAGLWDHADGGGWVIHDWAEYQELSLSEKRSEAGAKGGQRSGEVRRSKQQDEAPEPPKAKQQRSKTKQTDEANAEAGPSRPVPSRPEPTPAADAADDRFDEFWDSCPRKRDKGHARKAWRRALKRTDPATLVDAMRSHAEHWRSHGTEDRFIPHPATWLNGERWLDELVSADAGPPQFSRDGPMERNLARARGEACEACGGSGWVDTDSGEVAACECVREAS